MSTPVTITDPLQFDLTPENLRANSLRPIICGDTWTLRAQVLDADGAAVDLTDYTFVFVARTGHAGTITLELASLGGEPAAATEHFTIDEDQTEVSADGATGKGWYTFLLDDEEEAELIAMSKRPGPYAIRFRAPNGDETTHLMGLIRTVYSPATNEQIPETP